MPRRLKVFRTSIGFHDAYIAVPSRKAALEAWGSRKDLFAAGLAEEVTEPAQVREALAQPGVIIQKGRGSLQEQLAALGPASSGSSHPETAVTKPRARKPRPKPSRAALDQAEQLLAELDARQTKAEGEMERREVALRQARREMGGAA